MNKILLCGAAQSAPVLSHRNYGRSFYRFTLCVLRLSGVYDCIPVVLPDTLCALVSENAMLCVEGEVVLGFLNKATGRPTRCPEKLLEAIEKHINDR